MLFLAFDLCPSTVWQGRMLYLQGGVCICGGSAYSYHRWLPWAKQEASPTHKTNTSQSRFEYSQLII